MKASIASEAAHAAHAIVALIVATTMTAGRCGQRRTKRIWCRSDRHSTGAAHVVGKSCPVGGVIAEQKLMVPSNAAVNGAGVVDTGARTVPTSIRNASGPRRSMNGRSCGHQSPVGLTKPVRVSERRGDGNWEHAGAAVSVIS